MQFLRITGFVSLLLLSGCQTSKENDMTNSPGDPSKILGHWFISSDPSVITPRGVSAIATRVSEPTENKGTYLHYTLDTTNTTINCAPNKVSRLTQPVVIKAYSSNLYRIISTATSRLSGDCGTAVLPALSIDLVKLVDENTLHFLPQGSKAEEKQQNALPGMEAPAVPNTDNLMNILSTVSSI
jgi:hypothetical protein